MALLVSITGTTWASCFPRSTPSYTDIESIYLERSGVGEPHFTALATKDGQAFLDSSKGSPRIGKFKTDRAKSLFAGLLQVVRKYDYFNLRLQSYQKALSSGTFTIEHDGPDDHVAVLRCGVVTKLETKGTHDNVFLEDFKDPNRPLFLSLVESLQAQFMDWVWPTDLQKMKPYVIGMEVRSQGIV